MRARPCLSTSNGEMTMLYLAYGSNLNKRQMARRCPGAVPIGTVVVPDMRLVFRGVADIEEAEGHNLHCGVWRITKACERALDIYEGVGSGLYVREFKVLCLTQPDGSEAIEDALIYRMQASYYAAPGIEYLASIREGYHDFGLPTLALATALDHVAACDEDQLCGRSSRRHKPSRTKPRSGRGVAPRQPVHGRRMAQARNQPEF